MVTGLYAGILGLMLTVLIVRIALRRLKYRVGIGDGGIDDLSQAIRVHGNFAESAPILLIMLFLMEYSQLSPVILHGFGSLIVISRILHAYGITSSQYRSFGRTYGIALSLGLLTIGSLLLIIIFIGNLIT